MIIHYRHLRAGQPDFNDLRNDCVQHARLHGQIRRHCRGRDSVWFCSAVTVCEIYELPGDASPRAVGYAFCSHLDQFSRKLGRQISEGRAKKMLEKDLDVPAEASIITSAV